MGDCSSDYFCVTAAVDGLGIVPGGRGLSVFAVHPRDLQQFKWSKHLTKHERTRALIRAHSHAVTCTHKLTHSNFLRMCCSRQNKLCLLFVNVRMRDRVLTLKIVTISGMLKSSL